MQSYVFALSHLTCFHWHDVFKVHSHSSICQNSTPFDGCMILYYIHITFCLSIRVLMHVRVVSTFLLLWIMLWIWMYKDQCKSLLSTEGPSFALQSSQLHPGIISSKVSMIHLSPSVTWVWVVLQVTCWDFRSMLDFSLPALFLGSWQEFNWLLLGKEDLKFLRTQNLQQQLHTVFREPSPYRRFSCDSIPMWPREQELGKVT